MMTLSEKSAYIKGMLEMADLDESKKEVKILSALVSLVDDIANVVADLDDSMSVVSDELDDVNEYLDMINDDLYGDEFESEDEDDEYDEDEDEEDDSDLYEITCPECGETIVVNEETLSSDDLKCPACGAPLIVDTIIDEDEDAGEEPAPEE